MNQETLLKELVKIIENELDKKIQYNRIKDFYGLNLSTDLLSTYDSIFKEINFVLKDSLISIPLLL